MRASNLLLMFLAAAGACKRDEVTHVQVMKQAEPVMPPARAAAPMAPPGQTAAPGMSGDVPPPPAATGPGALQWTLPKGWTSTASGGMRVATLKAPVEGKLDVSVVVLGGPAGGELANVNRWRGQIGLAPFDDAGLAGSRKTVKAPAGAVSVYDFTGEGTAKSRLVAAIATGPDGKTWFVKMVGDAGAAGQAISDFNQLLGSLRFAAND